MVQKKLLYDNLNEAPFEVISLDDMNGFEFQRFVAHLFNKLGYGSIEEIRTVRDAGQDIRIRSPDGRLMIIECKHSPKGSVGRPIVQKLHSAVSHDKASKGFIVTTGRFSNDAINYAKNLDIPIELIDSKILYDMANRARIRVIKRGEKTLVFHILPPAQGFIKHEVVDNIIGNALSHPYNPYELAKTSIENIFFTSAYHVIYSLNEVFSTSVGVIHRIHISNDSILIDGSTGKLLDPKLSSMVHPLLMVENWVSEEQENVTSDKFKFGYTRAKNNANNHIRKQHTQTVSYFGANNVHYTKKCVPHVSKILIKSLTQVYIPKITASCSILTRKHQVILCGNKNDIDILNSDAGHCELCSEDLGHKRLLCNSCGRVVCPSSWFGHSYVCERCGKTICKECAYWTRKYILFKKKLCQTCAYKISMQGERVIKFG